MFCCQITTFRRFGRSICQPCKGCWLAILAFLRWLPCRFDPEMCRGQLRQRVHPPLFFGLEVPSSAETCSLVCLLLLLSPFLFVYAWLFFWSSLTQFCGGYYCYQRGGGYDRCQRGGGYSRCQRGGR